MGNVDIFVKEVDIKTNELQTKKEQIKPLFVSFYFDRWTKY